MDEIQFINDLTNKIIRYTIVVATIAISYLALHDVLSDNSWNRRISAIDLNSLRVINFLQSAYDKEVIENIVISSNDKKREFISDLLEIDNDGRLSEYLRDRIVVQLPLLIAPLDKPCKAALVSAHNHSGALFENVKYIFFIGQSCSSHYYFIPSIIELKGVKNRHFLNLGNPQIDFSFYFPNEQLDLPYFRQCLIGAGGLHCQKFNKFSIPITALSENLSKTIELRWRLSARRQVEFDRIVIASFLRTEGYADLDDINSLLLSGSEERFKSLPDLNKGYDDFYGQKIKYTHIPLFVSFLILVVMSMTLYNSRILQSKISNGYQKTGILCDHKGFLETLISFIIIISSTISVIFCCLITIDMVRVPINIFGFIIEINPLAERYFFVTDENYLLPPSLMNHQFSGFGMFVLITLNVLIFLAAYGIIKNLFPFLGFRYAIEYLKKQAITIIGIRK